MTNIRNGTKISEDRTVNAANKAVDLRASAFAMAVRYTSLHLLWLRGLVSARLAYMLLIAAFGTSYNEMAVTKMMADTMTIMIVYATVACRSRSVPCIRRAPSISSLGGLGRASERRGSLNFAGSATPSNELLRLPDSGVNDTPDIHDLSIALITAYPIQHSRNPGVVESLFCIGLYRFESSTRCQPRRTEAERGQIFRDCILSCIGTWTGIYGSCPTWPNCCTCLFGIFEPSPSDGTVPRYASLQNQLVINCRNGGK
jgi:hypothetical protein